MTSIRVSSQVSWDVSGSRTYTCAFRNAPVVADYDFRKFIVSKINDPTFALSVVELRTPEGSRHTGGTQLLEGMLYKVFDTVPSLVDESISTTETYTVFIMTWLVDDSLARNSSTSVVHSFLLVP